MIGETTLAMLYGPLLFNLFDRLSEGRAETPAEAPAVPVPQAGDSA
jgi:hypothetical protein